MDTRYSLSKDVLILEDKKIMLTYGIIAEDENGDKISEFNDVSVNREFTESIIELLNMCKVEPCHFYDVVIDELNR